MNNWRLWLRWSWRDLRERWLQVTAIAIIIALGTGVYAGMGSNLPWRKNAYDKSYALLHMYDLRVKLTGDSYLNGDDLLATVRGIQHASWIETVEPRLISPALVDATSTNKTILVPGQIMGVDVSNGGPHVNGIYIEKGRALTADDAGQNRAVLEYLFASYYHLPPQGTIQLSGGATLDYVGQGMTPEYFMVITGEISFMDEANFAVVMVPLETAQTLLGHPGMVNDLVLTLTDGADREVVQAEIEQAVAQKFPAVDVSFMKTQDDPAYTMLYGDMRGDEQIYMLIAYLFLAGAAFGTFNLASRIVEAQRRQIGIGMALGVPPRQLAIRPLLVGTQIALLGVVFGLGFGLLIDRLFGSMIKSMMPMPIFETPLQVDIFAQAAALGILLPFAATLYPVWRAVRVMPIDAIKTGYLVAKGGGLVPLLARIPLPGRSFTQMPFRNLLRSPRRTLMTLLGVGMAITTLVAMLGLLDSFLAAIDSGEKETLQHSPDRMVVALNSFYPVDSEQVTAIRESSVLSAAEPNIQVGSELKHKNQKLEVSLELLDMNSTLWAPTVLEGSRQSDTPGIVIAKKAAHDLGVKVGDMITLRYPHREGAFAYHMEETEVKVIGIHANPLRSLAYMDIKYTDLMGLQGLTNVISANPAAGVNQGDVQQAMFHLPGVTSVRAVAAMTQMLRDMMGLLIAFMTVIVIAVLALAFVIAFNSTSINVDERAREIATMFAFGLPIRTVVRMTMLENLVIGILGTLMGLGLGYVATLWMLNTRMSVEMPDVSLPVTLSALSILLAVILGIIVVAFTPLFSIRKMMRMDLSSTLRVVE